MALIKSDSRERDLMRFGYVASHIRLSQTHIDARERRVQRKREKEKKRR